MRKDELGKFICENRKTLGMTQEELAQKLFVTNKAVSKWEKGQSFPDIALLEHLAEVLGVSVAELIACEKEAKEEITLKKLLAENLKKERTKKIMAFLICVLLVFLICAAGEISAYKERDNFDYVCLNGLYYTFEAWNDSHLVNEQFLGEKIGEVTQTGIKRNGKTNRHGESNVYPVGAEIYDIVTEDELYQKMYAGRIYLGESAIKIDGKYYRGCVLFTNQREFSFLQKFYFSVYGKDESTVQEK